MQIRIYLEDVKTAVKRQLSIIGKHHATQRGDTLFSAATLSSVEEHVFQQFIIDGAQLVLANLSPVLTGYTVGELPDEPSAQSHAGKTTEPGAPSAIVPYLCFSVAASRTCQALSDAAQDSVQSLLVAYVAQAVLSMVLPDLAPKYAADVQSMLLAATRLVLAKSPPAKSPSTLSDFSGSVIF